LDTVTAELDRLFINHWHDSGHNIWRFFVTPDRYPTRQSLALEGCSDKGRETHPRTDPSYLGVDSCETMPSARARIPEEEEEL
jgi:hypothetical protein